MKKLVGILILTVLLIGGFYYITTQTDFFHVKSVVLAKPAKYLRPDHFEPLMDLNLITTKRQVIDQVIASNPYIAKYSVQRILPSTLKISFEERQEFAAIRFNVLYIIIDASGIVLDIRKDPGTLMLLEGFDFKSVHIGKPLNTAHRNSLQHTIQLILLFHQNGGLHFKVAYKSGIEVTLSETMKAKFGEGDDLQNQFVAFMTIYEDVMKKGILSGVIDVSKKDYYIFRPVDY
jgi:hypothetical protein